MNRTLRTALAALVAALSVAVMVDAQPAKASGSMSASLSISLEFQGLLGTSYDLLLSGRLPTSSPRAAQMLIVSGLKGEVAVWGEDGVWDDLILAPTSKYGDVIFKFEARPDGLYYWGILGLHGSDLNEDDSWLDDRDEIYASVRLFNQWGLSISANTNTVYGYYR